MNEAPASRAKRTHNASTYGADILNLAQAKRTSESGCIYIVLTHEASLRDLAAKYDHAVETKASLRECLLDHWYATPEGAKFKKHRDTMPKGKKRSEKQVVQAAELTRLENAIRNQIERSLDTYRGVTLLRDQKRKVHIERIDGTKSYACYVRSEAVLNEQTNTPFNASDLQTLNGIAKQFNEKTSTANVLAMCSTKKKGAANAAKGNSEEALAPSLIGKTLKQLDTALSPLAAGGKIEGVSKATRAEAHALWARLDAAMTSEEKTAAKAAFNSLAAKPEKKAKKAA
jgi:hypothetical protein